MQIDSAWWEDIFPESLPWEMATIPVGDKGARLEGRSHDRSWQSSVLARLRRRASSQDLDWLWGRGGRQWDGTTLAWKSRESHNTDVQSRGYPAASRHRCETFTDFGPTYICIVCATDESFMELPMYLSAWIQMFGPKKSIPGLDLTKRAQVW